MFKMRYCRYCKAYVGCCHEYQVGVLMIRHFQKKHPEELKLYEKKKRELIRLINKYGLPYY